MGGWESRSPHKQGWKRSLSHLCHFTFGETESWWARRTQSETWPQCRPSLQGKCPACLRIFVLHRQTLRRRGPWRRGGGGVVLALSELPLGPTHCTSGGHCAHLLWEARPLCAQRAPLPCPSQARFVHRGGGARRTQWLRTSSPADPGAGAESTSPSPSLAPPLGQCQRQGHPGAPRGAEVPLMLPAERKRAQVW